MGGPDSIRIFPSEGGEHEKYLTDFLEYLCKPANKDLIEKILSPKAEEWEKNLKASSGGRIAGKSMQLFTKRVIMGDEDFGRFIHRPELLKTLYLFDKEKVFDYVRSKRQSQ